MSSEEEAVYVLREDGEDEWMRPQPAGAAIVEAVTAATDLTEADLAPPDRYVDRDDLRALREGDAGDELTVRVEGHEVTVRADGTIDVA
jgi:hypothetical protein